MGVRTTLTPNPLRDNEMYHDSKYKTGEFLDLEKLPLGYAIHDQHDGPPNWVALFGHKAHLLSRYRMDTKNGDRIIDAMKGPGTMMYTNKLVVLVGIDNRNNVYHFAYSYDGSWFEMYSVTAD
jgi:hypothetical protein